MSLRVAFGMKGTNSGFRSGITILRPQSCAPAMRPGERLSAQKNEDCPERERDRNGFV
jgi:hypothetical protein